jgi:hypothetical protein
MVESAARDQKDRRKQPNQTPACENFPRHWAKVRLTEYFSTQKPFQFRIFENRFKINQNHRFA